MTSDPQTARRAVTVLPSAPAGKDRWRGHPIAATAVRIVAVSIPLLASVSSGVMLSHVLHRPHGMALTILWWLAIMVGSTVVLIVVDRGARRMLPLATLLKLSMAFPDQAPSRFRTAARAGTTRSLQDKLRQAEQSGFADGPAQAAQRILMLVGALGAHDRRTRGHSERVRAFNDLIAEEMRLPQGDRDRLRWAALLHDIGKLHVSTSILNKPKQPDAREWAILKSHPERGARIASPILEWLGPWAPTIVEHHERWDGTGYPHGLSGENISLGARIVAVADAYEVMTAPRPYSRPVSAAAARQELARCAGTQFDPEIVRAFLSISIGKLRKVIGPISWLAQLPLIGATPRLEAAMGAAGRQVASVAATATGTGVMAAALVPAAAHPAVAEPAHHHRHGHHHAHSATHHRHATAAHHSATTAGTGGATSTSTGTGKTSVSGGSNSTTSGPQTSAGDSGGSTTTSSGSQAGGGQTAGSQPGSVTPTDQPTANPTPSASADSQPTTPTQTSGGGNTPTPSPTPSKSSGSDPQPSHGKDSHH